MSTTGQNITNVGNSQQNKPLVQNNVLPTHAQNPQFVPLPHHNFIPNMHPSIHPHMTQPMPTWFPPNFGNMFNPYNPNHVPSEFTFSHYLTIAVLLSFIVGVIIFSINPPQVQKTCPDSTYIEQPPHVPTILTVIIATFFILLLFPAFVNN